MKAWLIVALLLVGSVAASQNDNFSDSLAHVHSADSITASARGQYYPFLDDSGGSGIPLAGGYLGGDFMPTYCGSGVWNFFGKVVWQDGYLYCAAPNGLLIFDVADPRYPIQAAQLFLSGNAKDVAVRGNLAYVTSYGDTSTGEWHGYLRVINVSDPHHPAVVGELALPNTGSSVTLNGSYAYIGQYAGIRTVDISDPSDLKMLDFDTIPTSNVRGVTTTVSGAFLYASCWDLYTFDISDPADPHLISTFDTPEYAGVSFVRDTVLFSGDPSIFAFPEKPSCLVAISIADPYNPRLLASTWFPGAVGRIIEYDDLIAVGSSQGIYWFEFADNDSLIEVAHYPWGTYLAYDGNYLYAAISGGCITVELPDDNIPVELGAWENWIFPKAIAVVDDWAYAVADDQTKMAAIHIEPNGDMAVTSTVDIPAWAWGVTATDSLVLVATQGGGLAIFDRTDPAHPTQLSIYPIAEDAYTAEVLGDIAYVATDYYGLIILDISDPANPQLIQNFLAPRNVTDIAIDDHYLYFPALDYGLTIADITVPRDPVLIGSYPNDFTMLRVFVEDHIAYTDKSGITAVDVSDPASPVLLGQLGGIPGGRHTAFLPTRKHAAVTLDRSGVFFIDLSDPANMHIDGWYDTPCTAYDLFATEEYVFIGDVCSIIRLCLPLPTDVPIDDTSLTLPNEFGLMPCYPNPFNSETTIPFSLERGSDISITICNILGERVRTVFNGHVSAGTSSVRWDGKNDDGAVVASGMYVVTLQTEDLRSSRRVLLIK